MVKVQKRSAKVPTLSPPLFERWGEQFSEPFARLRTEIDHLFDEFGGRPMTAGLSRGLASLTGPALELRESDNEYRLDMEVPGMTVDDIEIGVLDGVLSVKGERKQEHEEKEEGRVFSERRYGRFERAIALPSSVDVDKITAQCKDGLLTVHLPRSEEAASRKKKIPISKK